MLLLLLLLSRFSHVRLCATPWTAAYQAPPTTGFSRREYWSGLPLPKEDHKYILISVSQRHWFGSVQSFSCVCLFATPWTEARQASLSITISRSISSKWSLEMPCLNFQNLRVFDISLMIMCFITLKHYGI